MLTGLAAAATSSSYAWVKSAGGFVLVSAVSTTGFRGLDRLDQRGGH